MPSALRKESRVRRGLILLPILLAAVGLIATAAWGWRQVGPWRALVSHQAQLETPERRESADRERLRRQTPAAELAPTQLPAGLPLLGPPGQDAYGMPLRYVDGPALRSFLFHKRHEDLSRIFEQLQAEFVVDHRKEYWPIDAAAAFDSAEPSLGLQLDAWVAATPTSYAPYVARGAYRLAVAWARRGSKWTKDTADSDFAAMAETLPLALADVNKAQTIEPKSIAASRVKLKILLGMSRGRESRAEIERAAAFCPDCFQVRVAYILQLRPRWGGSYEQMAAFAAKSNNGSKKMRLLAGYIDVDKAQVHSSAKEHAQALEAIKRACALGEHWEFLLERGNIRYFLKDYEGALADLNAAEHARPGEPEIPLHRIRVFRALSRWEDAGRDLLVAARTRPTDVLARNSLKKVVEGLVYQGWEYHKAQRRDDALRLLDLAAELDPGNRDLLHRRAFIIEGRMPGSDGTPGQVAPDLDVLKRTAANTPDDLRSHQQLDYNLARQGKFAEVVEMWNGYIARHPDDGQAYLERGGAFHHLGKASEAKADAAKACELGITEGCRHAR